MHYNHACKELSGMYELRICIRIKYDTKFDMDQQVNKAEIDTNMIISDHNLKCRKIVTE